jgi:metal-sulfur cluster biosynthetic enzyme
MISERQVTDALRHVYDPELGINVVDLGLIYGLSIENGVVHLEMTLTSPGCPLGELIEDRVQQALGGLPGVTWVDLRLVWDPPWGPQRISKEALEALGWR